MRDTRHLFIFSSSFLAGISTDISGFLSSIYCGSLNFDVSLKRILFTKKFISIKSKIAVTPY
ncbi:MAG: hypothetical protein A2Z35_06565 [Actinobacteria bacterium RBG_19FT_COMBO_36_27]|nr:MAG: hypothetical protein A2Z35_06565 [Actinobacteria bacterium RBG_19FT_COMBO_36_27]